MLKTGFHHRTNVISPSYHRVVTTLSSYFYHRNSIHYRNITLQLRYHIFDSTKFILYRTITFFLIVPLCHRVFIVVRSYSQHHIIAFSLSYHSLFTIIAFSLSFVPSCLFTIVLSLFYLIPQQRDFILVPSCFHHRGIVTTSCHHQTIGEIKSHGTS